MMRQNKKKERKCKKKTMQLRSQTQCAMLTKQNNKRDETPNKWDLFIFVEKQKAQTIVTHFVMLHALKTFFFSLTLT